jgi:hypothetical protein
MQRIDINSFMLISEVSQNSHSSNRFLRTSPALNVMQIGQEMLQNMGKTLFKPLSKAELLLQ